MGHVGFTPQSVHAFGGFRVQGRGSSSDAVVADAQAVSDAGAFSIVLELIPADLATTISGQIPIPTIGIGAGAGCDGQIQVIHDVLGLTRTTLKHARAYASGWATASSAIESYTQDVREGTFPTEENSF
jgi:3-methyl-2-oxobutanoate hydroxymethyltransferase